MILKFNGGGLRVILDGPPPRASGMGGTQSKPGSSKSPASRRFDKTERESMKCVFDNLALRGHGRGLTLEIFLSFFMSNSLVGERLFHVFDTDKSGYLRPAGTPFPQ